MILNIDTGTASGQQIVLVQQTKDDTWGIVAGLIDTNSDRTFKETAGRAISRELQEETNLNRQKLNTLYPLGNIIYPSGGRLSLGFIYEASILANSTDDNDFVERMTGGYPPQHFSDEIKLVRSYSLEQVLELTQNPDMIYKPNFNVPLLQHWAFSTIFHKYEPWDGLDFAYSIAEERTGVKREILQIFDFV